MKEILNNIAMLDTLNYCKENSINYEGSHLYKYPRRYTYALVKDADGSALVTVTYYKNRVPSYFKA